MLGLNNQLMYSHYLYNDLNSEYDETKRNKLRQEIDELQPFYDVFKIRYSIDTRLNDNDTHKVSFLTRTTN